MMEETTERIRFLRYEIRGGVTVAVFAPDPPAPDWSWDDQEEQVAETVFDRASLQQRLANLRAGGYRHEVTAAALAAWPELPAEAACPPADAQASSQQKTAAVMRLLRGEEPEVVSRSLGVSVPVLIAWRDAFLAAGASAMRP